MASSQTPDKPSTLHAGALSGFHAASSYDAHRPSYPPAALLKLLQVTNLTPASTFGSTKVEKVVVDLAAGTGKMTTLLAQHRDSLRNTNSELRIELIAVEPHDEMRGELEKKGVPGLKVLVGTAVDIPLEDGSVDAVVVAQAFHWFSNHTALNSIARILKPGGVLAVLWNVEDYNSPLEYTTAAWTHPLRQHLSDLDPLTPDEQLRFRNDVWRQCLSPPPSAYSTPPGLQEVRFRWEVPLTKTELWDRWRTLSQIAVLEGDRLRQARSIFDNATDRADKNEDSQILVGGVTVVAWISKK